MKTGEGVKKAIAKIADALIAVSASVLENDNVGTNVKIGRNTLKNSALKGDLAQKINDTGDPVISALFNHYVVYLEWTRPPKYKKKPPISALKEWAAKNGIPTDASTLWAISYAIWRDGHAGRPIFATIDKAIDGLFMDEWADDLHDAVTENFNKLWDS